VRSAASSTFRMIAPAICYSSSIPQTKLRDSSSSPTLSTTPMRTFLAALSFRLGPLIQQNGRTSGL
jgi:hypothetical protein